MKELTLEMTAIAITFNTMFLINYGHTTHFH